LDYLFLINNIYINLLKIDNIYYLYILIIYWIITGVMYKNMVLTITNSVLPTDIHRIIDWFLYYNIADVSHVSIRKHIEPEYYEEDKTLYLYAVVEIKEWYNNNGSRNFYNNIVSGTAKMIYDDPQYWEVEFYEARTQEVELNIGFNNLETKLTLMPQIERQNACILPYENTNWSWGNGNDLNNMRSETIFDSYNSYYEKEKMFDNKPNDMDMLYNNVIKKKRKIENVFNTLNDLIVKKNHMLSRSTRLRTEH
jgi:hypothetical protein